VAKKVDLKAKAKRQKILAGVLGVLLLAVLGFEGPKMLKQLTGPGVDPLRAAQSSTTTPTGTVPLVPPTLGGSSTSTTPSSADLASSSGPSTPSIDQLTSFSLFASKDPFIQQVSPNGTSASSSGGSRSGSGPTGSGSGTGRSITPSSPGQGSTANPSQPKPAPAAPTAAVISVNGAPAQLIQAKQDFPLPPYDPIFQLVSLSQGSVKIAIAGGSYTSGAPTVTLKKGKPLTLENTADGTRYVLKLLWTGAGQPPANLIPPPSSAAATTPSSSPAPAPANSPTPSAPAPTTTSTTTTP
jgi:hypothetical protein